MLQQRSNEIGKKTASSYDDDDDNNDPNFDRKFDLITDGAHSFVKN